MNQSWNDIVAYFGALNEKLAERLPAIGGVEQLAMFIAAGPHQRTLFGWTSIHSLCIHQVDQPPNSGPFLRISPLENGMVEFRYVDTAIASRQWVRTVSAQETIARFEKFLDQLHWVARRQSDES